jgi:large subunit ribosomal protein L13
MVTHPTKLKDIQHSWHLVDAKGKVLGRLATHVAALLMGKSKPYFLRNMDCGDFVVVTNAQEVVMTGKKEKQKIYYHHSGYPGGLKATSAEVVRSTFPGRIITHAVSGMLPQNKLKDKMLTRLYIYPGQDHPYKSKFKSSEAS